MEFTREQQQIIYSDEDITVNAVAGAGKTSTLIAYARQRPKGSRILYLAFNKSVKMEAQRKFSNEGLTNVTVETAHGLAYKYVVYRGNYELRAQPYKTYEIVDVLGMKNHPDATTALILANHISKLLNYFCNSDALRVQDVNYKATLADPQVRHFVHIHEEALIYFCRVFLGKMDKGEIPIIHDFYLKKFQLLNPKLPYDYILFDEGQDASAAMLAIFLQQPAIKVIVGDTNQQIYSWRYAINSLEKTTFRRVNLSASFRFNQDVAELAKHILKFKRHIQPYSVIPIKGKGSSRSIKSKAIIGRTNVGLLLKAIAYISQRKTLKHIYFEGHLNTYTYAEEGASLYDIVHLYFGRKQLVRDALLKSMGSIKDLRAYIEQTGDKQLAMMLDIVDEYGEKVPGILQVLKDKHVSDEDKHKADIIFSTVHRAKGMEYDTVQLVNDFITEEKIVKQVENQGMDPFLRAKLNEEINLLYVAVTRSRNKVYVPESLFPNVEFDSTTIYKLRSKRPSGDK